MKTRSLGWQMGCLVFVLGLGARGWAQEKTELPRYRVYLDGLFSPVGSFNGVANLSSYNYGVGLSGGLEFSFLDHLRAGARVGRGYAAGGDDLLRADLTDYSLVFGYGWSEGESVEIAFLARGGINTQELEQEGYSIVEPAEGDLGWHLGVDFRAMIWVWNHLGVYLSTGWSRHWLGGDLRMINGANPDDVRTGNLSVGEFLYLGAGLMMGV